MNQPTPTTPKHTTSKHADPTLPSQSTSGSTQAQAFAIDAARLLTDNKCEDVIVLDVRSLSQVTDYIILGSGSSDRQMRSSLDEVQELGASRGYPAFRSDADQRAVWLLADFIDVVAHIFEPNTRAYYDLEMLWGDAPRIEWRRPNDPASRNRAGLTAQDRIDPQDNPA